MLCNANYNILHVAEEGAVLLRPLVLMFVVKFRLV